jgi:hypothetical protein
MWWFVATGLAAMAADAGKPHPHQGVLPRPPQPPTTPELSSEDLEKLAQGEPVMHQLKEASGENAGGQGVAVLDIHAEPSVVWALITDFDRYEERVPNVMQCDVVERAGEHIKVHFVIGIPLVPIEYWVDDTYRPDAGYLTWTLDYSKTSDFDDTTGFWVVQALPDRPGWSRAFYSVRVKARGWVPPPVEAAFSRFGLTRSTEWLKREAEKAATSTPR